MGQCSRGAWPLERYNNVSNWAYCADKSWTGSPLLSSPSQGRTFWHWVTSQEPVSHLGAKADCVCYERFAG